MSAKRIHRTVSPRHQKTKRDFAGGSNWTLVRLSQTIGSLHAEADPPELARCVVQAAMAQPAVVGARLWRADAGKLVVWEQAGQLPPAQEDFSVELLASGRFVGDPGTHWAGTLGDDAQPTGVLEAFGRGGKGKRGKPALDENTRAGLELLIRFAGLALANAARGRAVEHLSSIVEATKRLNSTLDLGELINIILQIATRETGADRGTVFLADRERDEIWSLVGLGLEQQEIRLPAARGIAGWVMRHGETVNLEDVYRDPRFEPDVDRRLGYHTRALLCLPIRNKDGETIGVLQLLNKRAGPFTPADESFLCALSDHVALALENAQLHRERLAKQRLERDLALARSIQAGLLPEQPPKLEGFEIGVSHQASEMVGGDYYDFVELGPENLLIVVADVEGKGVASALVMANLQATLRALATHLESLDRLVAAINRMIVADARSQRYLSMFIALFDRRRRSLRYITAGHVPPAVLRASGESVSLEEGGTLVGLFPDAAYKCGFVQLEAGDIVVACTDGITEATDARDNEYGCERLVEAVRRHRDTPAPQIVETVLADVESFSCGGIQQDDRVLLILKVL